MSDISIQTYVSASLPLRRNQRLSHHLTSSPDLVFSKTCMSQGLLFWLFEGGFKVSSDTVEWYRSSSGTIFDTSEIESPVTDVHNVLGELHTSVMQGQESKRQR